MDGMLSQEEINALIGGGLSTSSSGNGDTLNDSEKDALGEISNICMGTAATTLYSLVNQKVVITTPVVNITRWEELTADYARPCVFINIYYKEGIDGNNVLILKEDDVKIITDLMMGGDGLNPAPELSELHFSAICEAMNQMMGSSATSLSTMLGVMIDISPPQASHIDLHSLESGENIATFLSGKFVKIAFRMQIDDLVDSTILQLYPIEFAKTIYDTFVGSKSAERVPAEPVAPQPAPQPVPQPMPQPTPQPIPQPVPQPMYQAPPQMTMAPMQNVNVQPAQFQTFTSYSMPQAAQENMGLIMDVPLEVTVELGRTKKSISSILDFAPGTIIELDKIAGEPIDVLVNGKFVAKGEVVVIEESFGVRVTEIIK